jgi:hypothetical protein
VLVREANAARLIVARSIKAQVDAGATGEVLGREHV